MIRSSMPILVAIFLVSAGTASAAPSFRRPPLAGHESAAPTKPQPAVRGDPALPSDREGGETISDALFVEVLPFLDTGSTCDNLDDYDEACPFTGSTSPDVVYAYAPAADHLLDIDLCGSAYDTKVYVYENVETTGDPYACSDDYYGAGDPCGAWVSRIPALPVVAGVVYLIVIDGFGSDCGDYALRLDFGEPQPLFDVSFAQLTYGFEGFADVTSSNIGRMSVRLDAPAELGFLNVAAYVPDVSLTSEWIVRNLVVPAADMGPPQEMLAARFFMGGMTIVNGQPVEQIVYGYSITPQPLNDADVADWYAGLPLQGPVQVQPTRIETHGYGGQVAVPDFDLAAPPWWLSHVPPLQIEINSWIGCEMPNAQLDSTQSPTDWNGCAPAACANSLKWLEDQHDEIDFPPELRELFEQLSNLMNRLERQGAGPEQILKAKLDFIEAYDLPIHVKYQARNHEGNQSSSSGESEATDSDGDAGEFPTREWIEAESAAGEDVELGVGFYYVHNDTLKRDGGHAVVVTGTATVNGVPKIFYKHDTEQADGTGQEQEVSDIHELGGEGGIIHLPGLDGWIRPAPGADPVRAVAIVEAAFSESYDPTVTGVPATETFNGYCEWVKRTVAPGQKLKITFPGGYTRCENVTVYRLDRTVNPPKWVKEVVWNMNNFLMREWVNPYEYPVTIAIHNDDAYEYQNEYVPYEIEIAVVDAEEGDETSPGNPEAYGGFSLGGADESDEEFGDSDDSIVTVDAAVGVALSEVPRRLAEGTGTHTLILTHPIPDPNVYWEHLGVVIHVASVASPGQLVLISNAFDDTVTIGVDDVGAFEFLPDGTWIPNEEFSLSISAATGLDIHFDSIGIPSLTPTVTAVDPGDLPAVVTLEAAQPNPFNPSTTIRFALPAPGAVALDLYDVRGQHVASLVHGDWPAGRHEVVWRGVDVQDRPVATGVYIYRLRVGGEVLSRKLTLIR